MFNSCLSSQVLLPAKVHTIGLHSCARTLRGVLCVRACALEQQRAHKRTQRLTEAAFVLQSAHWTCEPPTVDFSCYSVLLPHEAGVKCIHICRTLMCFCCCYTSNNKLCNQMFRLFFAAEKACQTLIIRTGSLCFVPGEAKALGVAA